MECRINKALVHYVEHGGGVPMVALHGAGVDHREIEAAIEAVVPSVGYRRIYPDLPGMGRSTTDGLTCNDDVVKLLSDFIDHLSQGPVLLIGHSYGAYLARGLAAKRPDVVVGLGLCCPVTERSRNVPDHDVVRQNPDAYDELEPGQRAGFDEYFVVRTPATARRYRDHVVPGQALVDEAALGRIFAGWTVDVGSGTFSAPTLIVAGRRDSTVGYSDATELLECYPHATLAVIEGAGHALMHERPELLAALVGDWLDRTRLRGGQGM
jgi:pimeloyl-ACP methyl ester carboxylesterase